MLGEEVPCRLRCTARTRRASPRGLRAVVAELVEHSPPVVCAPHRARTARPSPPPTRRTPPARGAAATRCRRRAAPCRGAAPCSGARRPPSRRAPWSARSSSQLRERLVGRGGDVAGLGEPGAQRLVVDLAGDELAAVRHRGAALADRPLDHHRAGQRGIDVGPPDGQHLRHLLEAGDREPDEVGFGMQLADEQAEHAHQPGLQVALGLAPPSPASRGGCGAPPDGRAPGRGRSARRRRARRRRAPPKRSAQRSSSARAGGCPPADRSGMRSSQPSRAVHASPATGSRRSGTRRNWSTRSLITVIPGSIARAWVQTCCPCDGCARRIPFLSRLRALLGPDAAAVRQSLVALCLNSSTSFVAGAVPGLDHRHAHASIRA